MIDKTFNPLASFGKTMEFFGKSIVKLSQVETNKNQQPSFKSLLAKLIPNPVVLELMTYKQAVEYFVTQKPDEPKIKKGAMLRETNPEGELIIQVFLDESDRIVCDSNGKPYGHKQVVKQLDDELLEAFDNKNLLIFE